MKDIAENKKGNISFLMASFFIDILYDKSHKMGSLKLYDGENTANLTPSKTF